MTHLDHAPQVEVTITNDLRRLLSGRPEQPSAIVPTPATRPSLPGEDDGWQRIMLRQDGQRPLIFEGALLFRATSQTKTKGGETKQSIALFCTKTGAVVAEITAVPPAELAARPVFRCAIVKTLAGFADFLASYRPEQCFDVSAGWLALESKHQTQVISTMHADLRQMVTNCLTRPQQ